MDVASVISSPVTWIISTASAVYFIYWYGTSTFDYFSRQGIPGPKPLPYVGNMWGLWRVNLRKYDQNLVKTYGKTFGYFDGILPNLWTIDVDLIKSIFVKDFDHFINRRELKISMKVARKMVNIMENQAWKDVRSSITPAFTSGKIKRMSLLIQECANRLVDKFRKVAETEGKIVAKEQFSTFTLDVIARCAFGLAFKNLGEENDPFMEKAMKVFKLPVNKSPLILLPFVLPSLTARFSEHFFFKNLEFFIDLLKDLIQERASSTEKYDDFVQVATEILAEYTKSDSADGSQHTFMWNKEEVDEIVIAQSVIFLLAGFETTATTLTNTIFLLARHPEVQEKLYEEIVKKHEKFGEVSHDMILDFPYVDHVIHEVLRMYPPAPRIERMCNKNVSYNGITITKGTLVTVSAFALHYDEEYYPNPSSFNPDRWNPENDERPNTFTYMPFGMGPRNCIGLRFAMEEMKIALCTLVKSLRFFPVAETPEELQLDDGFATITQPIHTTVGLEARYL